MAETPLGAIDRETAKTYAAATEKISGAVLSMLKTDGWQIFLALYARERDRIKEKKDYVSLEDFKADRAAIDIVDSIVNTFKGYVDDAEDAAKMLAAFGEEDTNSNRGIMLIDAAEGATMEG